jgi:murein DD-endopeptidase MepM/ murein hydrolase activator NlpD
MPKNGVLVEKGDIVVPGQEVAKVGNTGNTTGPHLHYAVYDGKVSTAIRFEVGFANQTIHCHVPIKLPYVSTNY